MALAGQEDDRADEYARTGNMADAEDRLRLASYKYAIDILSTQQQNWDPRGTSAQKNANLKTEVIAQQQAFAEDKNRKDIELGLKQANVDRERALAASTIQHNRVDEAQGWTKIGLEADKQKAAQADNKLLTPDDIRRDYKYLPEAAIPTTPMTGKALAQHIETFNKSLETGNKLTANSMQQAGTQVMGADGKPLTVDGTSNGQPVVMPTHEQAGKLNEKVAGGQDLITSLGKVRRFLATDPSAVSRADWAGATTDFENAKFAYAKLHDTKASSRELEAMESLFGPNFENYGSRLKDKGVGMAHIDALINDAQATVASALRREAKYTGPSVLVDSSQPAPAAELTDADRARKAVMGKVDDATAIPWTSESETAALDAAIEQEFEARWPGVSRADVERRFPGIASRIRGTQVQARILDTWGAQLKDPDPVVRNSAAQQLGEAAGGDRTGPGAEEATVRRRALDLLTNNIAAGIPTSPEQVR